MEIVMKKPTVPGAEKPGGERPPVYRGKPGPQGPAGTIEIAQVVTIEPSDPARVENIGDSTNAKLILYIPKGDPGNRGEPGPAVEITEDIIQAIANELDLTPELVGLGNVDNTSDMDKPISKAQEEALVSLAIAIGDHVADKNNPHGVTIAQIGAAPAGYGYGGQSVALKNNSLIANEDDFDNELAKIYDAMNVGETKMITFFGYPSNSDWRFFGILSKSSASNGSLIAHSAYSAGSKIIKQKYGGTWQPCEWENPPMVAGVEYRTTERRDGKPVYRKSVVYTHSGKFGDSETNTDYTIPHGISGWVRAVRCVTSINNEVTGSYLGSAGGILCVNGFDATNINIRVYKTYFNSPIFRFDLAYIKE